MRRPSARSAALVVAGSLGAAVALRRRRRGGGDRVDLYYDDGSMVSLGEEVPEAARLLPRARSILASAGS